MVVADVLTPIWHQAIRQTQRRQHGSGQQRVESRTCGPGRHTNLNQFAIPIVLFLQQ